MMIDYGLLNLGSLLFGVIAWILPVINLAEPNKKACKKWIVFSVISLSACAISLCMQIFYHAYLVRIEDFGALMDISGAMAIVCLVLLVVTITLNVITLVLYGANNKK